jgi:2-polyprenyl-3-methyl-5-hydroxy-6-metoxy-1,4-benzoquinol methylase
MVDLASHADFKTLLRREGAEGQFAYIDPPFNFNNSGVAKFPPEVTGHFLLNSLCRRFDWGSLNGRRLLDFGCGVRFARTLVNLAINIDLYAGIDANREAIRTAPLRSMRAHCKDLRSPISTRPACFRSSRIRGRRTQG